MKPATTSKSATVNESRKNIKEIDSALNITTDVSTVPLPSTLRPIFTGKVFTVRRHHRQPLRYSHAPNIVWTSVCCLVFRTGHFQHSGTQRASLLYILIRLLSTPTLFPATTKLHTVDSHHVTV
ncbi:hypothetical protein E2C01_085514 [Portunus trituberculatus]|uniref:Uncharacterized protein n=1 Tax=Portunus trituberculatus TaxID=210409 RepID=A0A5B7J7T8_PORTR|nr:hypothetical protein [Portunus trituberculatus]